VYAFLLAILASLVTAIGILGQGRALVFASPAVVVYGATVVLGAVALGLTGHPAAAWYCVTAPLAAGLGALTGALRPGMQGAEMVGLAALSVLWLGYAARVVRIARRLHGRA
jgi:hypothetical protein